MLLYLIRMAFKSLKRNPVLSGVMIGTIGLGIGVSTTFITTYYRFSMNPIPHKSEVLFYVQMDNWDPNRPWDEDDPTNPPSQITYRDMVGIMESEIPTYQGGSFKSWLYVHPDPDIARPYKAIARMCFGDFFHLFDVPFEYGSGWDKSADAGPEPVIVLSHETNQKLFGGQNSVGKMVRIEDRQFKVVGVLSPWRPFPKFYDAFYGAFEKAEEMYMPFENFRPLNARSAGYTSNWKDFDWNNLDEYLASEAIWILMWVQLDDEVQKAAYLNFLDSYVDGQKKLGRMLRPTNNRLYSVMELLEDRRVVPDAATGLMVIALLFLVVCALNLIGILLGMFLARAPEVSVRRAMGASRVSVFLQYLVRSETVGVLGGLLGISLAMLGLKIVNSLFSEDMFKFQMDGNMLLVAVFLSLFAGLIAGAYPAWRVCSIPPVNYLKEQ